MIYMNLATRLQTWFPWLAGWEGKPKPRMKRGVLGPAVRRAVSQIEGGEQFTAAYIEMLLNLGNFQWGRQSPRQAIKRHLRQLVKEGSIARTDDPQLYLKPGITDLVPVTDEKLDGVQQAETYFQERLRS